jgi:hypothetical protein
MTEEHSGLDQILDQDFSMGDDGELVISEEALRGAQEPAPDVQSPEAAESPEDAPRHDWEDRYKNLEPEFTRRSQRLAELEKDVLPGMQSQIDQLTGQLQAVIAGQHPDADDTQDDRVEIPENFGQILMQDPAQGAGLIAEISDRVMEKKLGPVLERVAPMLEDWELESELREAALKPGREDFFELLPTIRDIIVRSPEDISFDAAYGIAKSFSGVDQLAAAQTQPQPSEDPQPAQQVTERVSPEEAQQIASRLAPDTGVSGEVQPERRVADTVEDAFNMAVEDVLGE